jgi:hypothetical protein
MSLPAGIESIPPVDAIGIFREWLLGAARRGGEAALDEALGAEWPGTQAQREMLPQTMLAEVYNEAKQLATWGLPR